MKWEDWELEKLRLEYPFNNHIELSKLLNRTRGSISNKAKRLGLTKPNSKFMRYKVNSKFFGEYTNLSCYWAGFICGDGCIVDSNKVKSLQIMLSAIDTCHLETFVKQIEYEGLVNFNKKRGSFDVCRIIIRDDSIAADLHKNFNIGPRKTYTCSFPYFKNLSETNKLAYLCGYIDADGSIYETNKKSICLQTSGTVDLLNEFKEYLDITCSAKSPYKNSSVLKNNSSNHVHVLSLSNQRVVKLYSLVNNLGLPLLNRKWSRVKEFILKKEILQNDLKGKQYSSTKGVTFDKRRHRWIASFYNKSKNIYLGSYLTEDEAKLSVEGCLRDLIL